MPPLFSFLLCPQFLVRIFKILWCDFLKHIPALGALGGWALTRAHYTTYSDYASPSVTVPVEITNNNNPTITASASGSADATNTNNDDDTLSSMSTNTNTATNNGRRKKRGVNNFNLYNWIKNNRRGRRNSDAMMKLLLIKINKNIYKLVSHKSRE